MKLLSSALSPYAARVRLAIYARNLPVEIAPSGLLSTNRDAARVESAIAAMNEGLGYLSHYLRDEPYAARHKSVADYQRRIQDDPAVTKLLGEMRTALAPSRLKALVGG